MVDLKKLLVPRKRRKKARRAEAPKTIVPPRDPFDAARERLRRQIPPPPDES